MNLSYSYIFLLHLVLIIFFMLKAPTQIQAQKNKRNSVPAIFVFGDSTADTGNNNKILTAIRSNFKPYGRDFPNQESTGRFCNGRLICDFVVKHLGIKEAVPPYSDKRLGVEDLRTGVSFASAGTGFDPLTSQLTELLDEGVRKIAVTGLGPLGCLPSIITVHSENAFSKRECVDSISSMAREFNVKIQKQLKATQNKFANLSSRIGYVEVYKPTMDILLRPKSHGFENINTGCCGTGFLEFALSCNPLSYVCPNVSKNYFWDSVHPTERAYYLITQAILPTIDSITK
ncbi:hypothetical protein P3S68_025674 [Capsicum galapagoense]